MGDRRQFVILKWFHKRVDKSNQSGCWLWTGTRSEAGYGRITVRGQRIRAHRFAYELFCGPIPPGMFIDHLCSNKSCVNPEHLRVVTPEQNAVENNDSCAAVNARKTHCKRGHEFDIFKEKPNGSLYRECSTCNRLLHKRYRSKLEYTYTKRVVPPPPGDPGRRGPKLLRADIPWGQELVDLLGDERYGTYTRVAQQYGITASAVKTWTKRKKHLAWLASRPLTDPTDSSKLL